MKSKAPDFLSPTFCERCHAYVSSPWPEPVEVFADELFTQHYIDIETSVQTMLDGRAAGCVLCSQLAPTKLTDPDNVWLIRQYKVLSVLASTMAITEAKVEVNRVYSERHNLEDYDIEAEPASISFSSFVRGDMPLPLLKESGVDGTTFSVNCKRWLSKCEAEHNCAERRDENYVPPRVLDIRHEKVRLVEGQRLMASAIRYATLSHRWGSTIDHLVLTTENKSELERDVHWESIPETFQDAIKVTRSLDIDFIWIDSLCIIQRGALQKSDWAKHLTEMRLVYSNGVVNIGATEAKGPHSSLFYPLTNRKYMPMTVDGIEVTQNGSSREVSCHDGLASVPHNRLILGEFPLDDRAWVYQERLLSSRMIHYTDGEVFWKCKHHAASSCLPSGFDQHFPHPRALAPSRTTFDCYEHDFKPTQDHINIELDAFPHITLWNQVAHAYSRTKITYPMDRLPAVAAMAHSLALTSRDSYLAGHFRSSLPGSLLWQPLYPTEQTGLSQYIAPSWSFVSINGPIEILQSTPSVEELLAECLDVKIDFVSPDNPYGLVNRGLVTLRGPCFPLLCTNDLLEESYLEQDGLGIHMKFDWVQQSLLGRDLFALAVLRVGANEDWEEDGCYGYTIGVLLEGKGETVKRVGRIEISHPPREAWDAIEYRTVNVE